MATVAERVTSAVAPILEDLELLLYDVEIDGKIIRITIDSDGEGGLDLAHLTASTRAISKMMDDFEPMADAYTLEVSSPGLERNLRTPLHFQRAVGAEIIVKTRPGTEGDRRLSGKISVADDDTITLLLENGDHRTLRIADIERARTTFSWGPAPKPGKGPARPKEKAP